MLAAAAVVAPLFLPGFLTFQLTQVVTLALALVGLNVLTGWAGQPSLGQGAFFAIGAYLTAILIQSSISWWLALPLATVIGCLIAVGLGSAFLRLERTYLALATFAWALAVPQLLHFPGLSQWTGGAAGLQLTRPAPPPYLPHSITEDVWMYWISLFVALGASAAVSTLLRGRLGLTLRALRDHPVAAGSCGIDITRAKSQAFAISAACACAGGGLYALSVQLVSPESFTVFLSLTMLVALTIGGVGTTCGPWIGAVFVQTVPALAEKVSSAAPWAIFGCSVLLVVFVEPRGLLRALERLTARISLGGTTVK